MPTKIAASHPRTVTDQPTYTVNAFCKAHHISRAFLYRLWSQGRGPDRTKLGRRTLITGEAAARWRRRMEEATPPLDAPTDTDG